MTLHSPARAHSKILSSVVSCISGRPMELELLRSISSRKGFPLFDIVSCMFFSLTEIGETE